MAVQLDPVPGGDDLGRQRRTPLDLLAGEEEGRRGAVLAQRLQHGRRPLRVRAVVEGEGDAVRAGHRARSIPSAAPKPWHERRERRAGVQHRRGGDPGSQQRPDQGAA